MNKVRHIFTFALLTLLFAACSEDDILRTPSTGETEGTETVTFTATVDYSIEETGDGAAKASTRAVSATEDNPPTRFYAQAYDETAGGTLSKVVKSTPNTEGKIVFTIPGLNPSHTYTYMFWADNADGDADPTDLCRIPYTAGNIAFAATENGKPTSVNKTVDMKHAVTKVTLRTSAVVTVAAGGSVGITTNCGTGYNVLNSEVTSSSSLLLTKTFDAAATFNAGDDVASFYFLPTSTKQQDVTIRNFRLLERTLPDIPLAANRHVTLQGDLNTDDENWATTNAYIESQFRSYFFNEDGTQISDVLSGNADDITALFKVITRNENYSLQNGLEYIYGIQGSFHNYLYIYNYTTYYIIGFADNDATYAWSVYTDPWYEPFPKPNE